MEDIYGDFWQAFLEETGTPETTVLENYTYFGGSEEESVRVLEQLLSGEKTAISHCIPAYLTKKQRMPREDDYTMVTDFYGNPCCILHTTGVTIAPMPELPEELMQADVPGCTREDWLRDRAAEYEKLAEKGGFHFHSEIPVLMETVELVYPAE